MTPAPANTMPVVPKDTEVNIFGKSPFKNSFLTRFKNKLEDRFADKTKKGQLVVLGGGWATVPLINTISPNKYHITVISPNDSFSFTPLLPSVVGGRLSLQAVIGRLRGVMDKRNLGRENYIKGWAEDVELDNKLVQCSTPNGGKISLPYDYLVVGVGAVTNDFGIPGVKDNTMYLKNSDNAKRIHEEVMKRIDSASKTRSEDDIKQLGHFVCVGAGPSGVETAAEIQDLISKDVRKQYPALAPKLKVSLIEMLPKVLPMFSEKVSKLSGEHLVKQGINLELETRVSAVEPKSLTMVKKDNKATVVPSGLVVWTSGITQTEFAKKLKAKIPEQNPFRLLTVSPNLNVIGREDIFGIGDCAFVKAPLLANNMKALVEKAGGVLSLDFIRKNEKELSLAFPQITQINWSNLKEFEGRTLKAEESKNMLEAIDKMYRAPAPTAQNARQAGVYLGKLLNEGKHYSLAPAFVPQFRGRACYIGGDRSVVEFPNGQVFSGPGSFLLWQTMYLTMVLTGNRSNLVGDWVRSSLFGRFGAAW